ncbi:plasmid partitioning protein RepB C-terminal domain-containing protein [Lysobacter soli]|uniref:plasmid partitioning protein RepB C-terminal domain-containing protein n=1 Tax=Lysobacter soli TaxID=453783 RepID=UPI001E28387F|nr:plasmid partitioning protein RepB C-terminal domain-containing protein [Lysobacter soli]
MIMSLVENVARRQHPAVEIMREIETLRKRGYDDQQIAGKIGTTASWVSMVAGLLDNGEERLVAAVETGLMPISMAVQISRSDDADVQRLLTEAYAEGALRGKKLGIVRRILEQRTRRGKSERHGSLGRRDRNRKLTVEQLKRVYEREVEKQQILIKKADITQNRLMFITRSLRELRADKQFVALLRNERMETLPRALAERMTTGPS